MPHDIIDNRTWELAPKTKEDNDETCYQNEQARHRDGL